MSKGFSRLSWKCSIIIFANLISGCFDFKLKVDHLLTLGKDEFEFERAYELRFRDQPETTNQHEHAESQNQEIALCKDIFNRSVVQNRKIIVTSTFERITSGLNCSQRISGPLNYSSISRIGNLFQDNMDGKLEPKKSAEIDIFIERIDNKTLKITRHVDKKTILLNSYIPKTSSGSNPISALFEETFELIAKQAEFNQSLRVSNIIDSNGVVSKDRNSVEWRYTVKDFESGPKQLWATFEIPRKWHVKIWHSILGFVGQKCTGECKEHRNLIQSFNPNNNTVDASRKDLPKERVSSSQNSKSKDLDQTHKKGELDQAKQLSLKKKIAELTAAVREYALDTGKLPLSSNGLDVLIKNVDSDPLWKGPYHSDSDLVIDPWGEKIGFRKNNDKRPSYEFYLSSKTIELGGKIWLPEYSYPDLGVRQRVPSARLKNTIKTIAPDGTVWLAGLSSERDGSLEIWRYKNKFWALVKNFEFYSEQFLRAMWTDTSGGLWGLTTGPQSSNFWRYHERHFQAISFCDRKKKSNDLYECRSSVSTEKSSTSSVQNLASPQVSEYRASDLPIPFLKSEVIFWKDNTGKFWILDSSNERGGRKNHTWAWNGTKWSKFSIDRISRDELPTARESMAHWTDARGHTYIYGGLSDINDAPGKYYHYDFWNWDGSNWRKISNSSYTDCASRGGNDAPGSALCSASSKWPGARYQSTTWHDSKGHLWLYGGINRQKHELNDLWKWNGKEWTLLRAHQGLHPILPQRRQAATKYLNPPSRTGSVSWVDTEGSLWLHGGHGYSIHGPKYHLNELWKFSDGKWIFEGDFASVEEKEKFEKFHRKWKREKTAEAFSEIGLAISAFTNHIGRPPTQSEGIEALIVEPQGVSNWKGPYLRSSEFIFGFYDDTIRYSYADNYIELTSAGVDGRFGTADDLQWLFKEPIYPELTQSSSHSHPGIRQDAALWTNDKGESWLFGGFCWIGNARHTSNDLWKWNGKSWTWLSGSKCGQIEKTSKKIGAESPSARFDSTTWTDKFGNIWLFGGASLKNNYESRSSNDLWMWNGQSWKSILRDTTRQSIKKPQKNAKPPPSDRPVASRGAVTWVDSNGDVWLYTGESGWSENLNDIWKWNGKQWKLIFSSSENSCRGDDKPHPRIGPSIWVDSKGHFFLFGGASNCRSSYNTTPLNDLWEWDGKVWKLLSGIPNERKDSEFGRKGVSSPEHHPPARVGATSWIDSSNNLYLFAGNRHLFTNYKIGRLHTMRYKKGNDLWRWNGTDWAWISGHHFTNLGDSHETSTKNFGIGVPGARSESIAARSSDGGVIIFAGTSNMKTQKCASWYDCSDSLVPLVIYDSWKWDGKNWRQLANNKPSVVYSPDPTYKTHSNAESIQQALWDYAEENGKFPASLVELQVERSALHSSPYVFADSLVDGWGNAFNLSDDEGYPVVISRGSDRIAGTTDDLKYRWVNEIFAGNDKGRKVNTPGRRVNALIQKSQSGNIWMFGGSTIESQRGVVLLTKSKNKHDLWRWKEKVWEKVSEFLPEVQKKFGSGFSYAKYHMTVSPNDHVYIYATIGLSKKESQATEQTARMFDLWKWDGQRWIWLSGAQETNKDQNVSQTPDVTKEMSTWADSNGDFWIFGGNGAYSKGDFPIIAAGQYRYKSSALWRWSGNEWSQLSGTSVTQSKKTTDGERRDSSSLSISPRTNAKLWRDASTGQLMLFGGFSSDNIWLRETWTWDGKKWKIVSQFKEMETLADSNSTDFFGPDSDKGLRICVNSKGYPEFVEEGTRGYQGLNRRRKLDICSEESSHECPATAKWTFASMRWKSEVFDMKSVDRFDDVSAAIKIFSQMCQ